MHVRRWVMSGACVALALVGTGCGDPTVVQEGALTVIAESDAFLVRNRSESFEAVHIIIELQASALIDLVPCRYGSPGIAPGQEQRVLFEDVLGFTEDARTATVHWCLLNGDEPVDGGNFTVPFRQ